MKNYLIAILALLWSALLPAQAIFEANADAEQVFVDGYFEVRFTLKNSEGTNFEPPPFYDFRVLSGPSRSMSTTVINGRVSKEMSFSYTLQPRRTGIFNIGPAEIMAEGNRLRTDPIRIEVLQRQDDVAAGRQFYVDAVPSRTDAYVGQQIRLDYRLYTKVEIQNYNIIEEPDYVGFYAEDIRRPDTRLRQQIINGDQYYVRTLKSIALYPQQAGTLTIPPATLQLGVVTGEQDSYSLFFGNNVRRVPVTTDSLNITVKSLPRPVPEAFSGAVGDFRLRTSINRNTLTTDDALSVTMEISGNGDMKRVQAPDPDLPPSFDQYDPEVEEYDLGELNGFRQGQKVYTFLAQPREAGIYEIAPTFVYFDPDSAIFKTLAADTLALTIRQGSQRSNAPDVADDLAVGPDDIGPLRLNTRLRKQNTFYLVNTPVFWTLAALPAFLFFGMLVYRRRRLSREATDPAERRRREAQHMAMQRLETAKAHLESGNNRAFYDEVSKAMLGYVSDKLGIPWSELTKDNVRIRLESLGVDQPKMAQFMQILQNCEMALFAGKANTESMQETYDHSLDMLATIEQQLAQKPTSTG